MSNQGPRQPKSYPSRGIQAPIRILDTQISFDNPGFIDLIDSHGIRFEHWRAIPSVEGIQDKGDNHGVGTGHVRTNSDGFDYERAGCLRAFFQSNNTSQNQLDVGAINYSSGYITLPETYDDPTGEPVLVMPFDRLFMVDVQTRVLATQFVEATSTGIDKLQYPATCVEYCKDANGVRYHEGTDFEITPEGHIKWITQNRPGWNAKIERGTMYSIRYRYTGWYVVARLMHEIRVANIQDPATFDRITQRMPYQVQVVRENVYLDRNLDPLRPNQPGSRFDVAPDPAGSLGPNPAGILGPPGPMGSLTLDDGTIIKS